MELAFRQNPGLFLPIFFLALWVGVSAFIALMSGWLSLMRAYPDRDEQAFGKLTWQSGAMALGVRINGILHFGLCPSGLRIGVSRIFSLFCRDFFVPWSEISVTREDGLFWRRARLEFGVPPAGFLILDAFLADRLGRASEGKWPEPGPFPQESKMHVFWVVAAQWAVMTLVATTFFVLAPRLAVPPKAAPPLGVAILFPAIVFGLVSLVRFLRRIRD